MNRQEIIQQHLDNTFVYARAYRDRKDATPDLPEEYVELASKDGKYSRYHADVLASVRQQLEKVPEDILQASASSALPDGTTHKPMAIVVLESDEDAYISLPESAVLWKSPFPQIGLRGGFLSKALDRDLRPEWEARTGNIMFAYRPSLPPKGTGALVPEIIAQQDFKGHTVVHEFGHYYLHCCITKDKKEEFLSALSEAVTQDVAADAAAVSPGLIGYVQKRTRIHPNLDAREEYFCYLLQQLSGGKSRFDTADTGKMFELESCSHVLNCVLRYHPGWLDMVKAQVPDFEVKAKSSSWGADVQAERRGRAPWE